MAIRNDIILPGQAVAGLVLKMWREQNCYSLAGHLPHLLALLMAVVRALRENGLRTAHLLQKNPHALRDHSDRASHLPSARLQMWACAAGFLLSSASGQAPLQMRENQKDRSRLFL